MNAVEESGQSGVSLFDVLPIGRASADGCWEKASFAVPRELGPMDTQRLLAALALAEARLTGHDRVQATVVGDDGARQATLSIPRAGRCGAWLDGLEGLDMSAPGEAHAVVWAVLAATAGTREETLDGSPGIASGWRVGEDGQQIEVVFRAPLGTAAIALLRGCVLNVLAGLATPGLDLGQLDVLGCDERATLHAWSGAGARPAPDGTVPQRFAHVVQRTPDAPAVVDEAQMLTYAQLDERSTVLARTLARAGVSAGEVVGLALPRSAEAIVAMLGILKAGAAYLPVDLSQPAERVAFLLRDARASKVVCRVQDGDALPADVHPVDVAAPAPDCGNDAVAAADAPVLDGEALAYVLYTSGSTGVPKGVEIPHRAILRLVCDVDFIRLDAETRMLHAAPLGFDASTLEIWGPLLNGGRVVVHPEAVPTGAGVAEAVARHGVTTAWLTAALFNTIVDEDPTQLGGLSELFTGGEALSVEHVRRMRLAAPGVALHNGYGPTECTTFTCTHRVQDVPAPECASIPIGRPIAATRVYVLNAKREFVPVGVAGELYVGGAGVARGYLARPELTAERFVPDPFGEPGEMLYRTGDQVRWCEEGVLEFIGRMDTQVKVRGYRIELGEVEATLARHPAVKSCVVLARNDTGAEKRLVAYYVGEQGEVPASALRAFVANQLPEFMVPARFVAMDAWPVTPNGKLDRAALPAPDRRRPECGAAYETPVGDIETRVCDAFSEVLDLERVGRHDNFFELGGSSLQATQLTERLRRSLPERAGGLAATAVFAAPTPASLALALDDQRAIPGTGTPAAGERWRQDDPIAIVAMAGRFPGANSVEQFWRNLCDGLDTIMVFSPDQLDPSIPESQRMDDSYVPARGVIDGVEEFDAGFFGFSPREAELMDPQHRIFLELCWECMERGGHVPDAGTPSVGVFAGMYNPTYFQRHVAARTDLIERIGAFQVMLENEKDYITTRAAHKLNLTGPAVSVHTACSTSLVAICQAVDSLRAGRCTMALAGGSSVACPPRSGYRYQEGGMLSPDGHTRSFDADAQGTVFSDGAAVILLKRWSDAVRDGNTVHAVIRGCAVNNDGAHKASFTAPSSAAQAAVVAMAQDEAGVDPRSIGYVETHGTATPLGDPIEVEGLTAAFRRATADVGFCRIGSVKSNIGHTVAAAGATGVIKAALALHEQCIPATAHFRRANPVLGLEASPFVVNATREPWPRGESPRRAGVSSFGVGGTNAHVVLEEAPVQPDSEAAVGPQLLVLSARTPTALARAAVNLGNHLERHPQLNLADVAWTLAAGRKVFPFRLAITAESGEEAAAALGNATTQASAASTAATQQRDVVFLFPGQGATYAGMGRDLYARDETFRATVDECAAILAPIAGFDVRELMFTDDENALLPTSVMQPATFVLEYALASLWLSLGVKPVAMVGHSVGEFVAATLAGVFSLADALRLVAKRGAWMQSQPPGGMLSVRLGWDALTARLPDGLSLAAENAPGSCVVAGPSDVLGDFQARLEAEGVACRALRTSHAFHSSMMEPVVAPFLAEVESVARAAPSMPIVSTSLGQWLDPETAMSPAYWARHLREPVRFASALSLVLEGRGPVLLEVGPRATLGALARQHPLAQGARAATVATLSSDPADELRHLRAAMGALWCGGAGVDPGVFDRRTLRRRLCLPTYPFERQRYWIEATLSGESPESRQRIEALPAATVVPIVPPVQESVMPAATQEADRTPRLIERLKAVFEDIAGFDLADASPSANFMELGLDSLMLTQVALQLEKALGVKVSFRQLMGECSSLGALAERLDAQLPPDAPPATAVAPAPATQPAAVQAPTAAFGTLPTGMPSVSADDFTRQVIAQQMQLMAQQLAVLGAGVPQPVPAMPPAAMPVQPAAASPASTRVAATARAVAATETVDEEATLAHTRYDVKKAFGAIARIDSHGHIELSDRQRTALEGFIARYTARTRKSKEYTRQHRPHMADPRVVNGFRPLTKEIIYQIVVERSKGAHLVDVDGNDYVDALNGFGMSLFGWQPDFVVDAVKRQIELGYEIGPQHPLSGEVAKLVCDVTGHDRAALCNTGSEAVLGALRIARTVTGRETVVLFTGAYHGIIDEMIVRGTRKLRAVPAAPGILRNTAEHVLVLEYGTEESMRVIRERAGEIAAVLVEPVQSRRPDFQPREFLHELRQVTEAAGALLVFDEVVTGFRAHPAGAQGLFGIRADLATYGKVLGGGFPIGVIAGRRDYMDALDGGQWDFGDDSVPEVGVTYFAGTFVRHPLALAAARAVLGHIQENGAQLQSELSDRTAAMVGELNAFCAERGAPVEVRYFASVWKTFFLEDHPLQDLLFAMMRSRGVHILDNFPCFLTTAHSAADLRRIIDAFKDSVVELQEAEFLPRHTATPHTVMDAGRPAVAGARLGRDSDGRPAWFVPNPEQPGKYMKVGG